MKPTLRILHNLARSGGTIVARCLASMDGVALLSEIHPDHGIFDPAKQAREWYGIDVPTGLGFVDTIAAIETACRAHRQALVLRSWDHIDYMPSQWRADALPMHSTIAEALAPRFELRRAAVIRDARAMFASLRRFLPEEHCPQPGAFARGHQAFFAMALGTVAIVSYPAFVKHPEASMQVLCDGLGLTYDGGFVTKWQRYRNVTGDLASFDRTDIGPSSKET